jgi:hypothetical protein
MAGHVAVRHIAVLGFKQNIALRPDQDAAERMIAVLERTIRNRKSQPQAGFVVDLGHGANLSKSGLKMQLSCQRLALNRAP